MNHINVFYTPKMVADSRSASPSAAKPEKVVESWMSKFNIRVYEPIAVTVEDYALAHHRPFVEDILDCVEENGFGNKSREVANSLPYTTGAMLSAARHAIFNRSVAAAPCSGFHHAGFYRAGGYCTFNGLMVTAQVLLKNDGCKKIGILDFDMHYGNGTDDIIQKLQLKDSIVHYTAGARFEYPQQADDFFKKLPEIIQMFSDCDVVLYQAGADPHINDPHGGWLTTEQLKLRDGIVFQGMKDMNVPVAWNLAGGYQVEPDGSIPKVLEIHDNTMSECERIYGKP